MTLKGTDAAVRSLRGTGKRAGTCVMSASGDGSLLPFIIIYKRKTKWEKKEAEAYKKLKHVHVVMSNSSYINEDIWSKEVVGQVYTHLKEKFGEYWFEKRYILASDGHGAHFTTKSLAECARNSIFPVFTPPNFTSHFQPIDDLIGQQTRAHFYSESLAYEDEYFEEYPDGDGGISAGVRRIAMAEWWESTWEAMQEDCYRQHRINSFRRCGFLIGVDCVSAAGQLRLPDVVRFKKTEFAKFGETLNPEHPEFLNREAYNFSYPESRAKAKYLDSFDAARAEEEGWVAEDEDGWSYENPAVFVDGEDDLDAGPSADDDSPGAEDARAGRIEGSMNMLKEIEAGGKRIRAEKRARKAAEKAARLANQ